MADVSRILGTWLDFYGELMTKGMTRIRKSTQSIEDGTYTADLLFKDTLFWMNGMMGLWTIPLKIRSQATPTAFIRIEAKANVGSAAVSVDSPEKGKVDWTPLQLIGGNASVAKSKVVATLDKDRTTLGIRLKDLSGTLKAGHYVGIVFVGDAPLALVRLLVTASTRRTARR